MNSLWSELIYFATYLAALMSSLFSNPIENVMSFWPCNLRKLEAILATRLESRPPERRHPCCLLGLSLVIMVYFSVSTILCSSDDSSTLISLT